MWPAPAVHVCTALSVILWLTCWMSASKFVMPPAPIVSVLPRVEMRLNAPALLRKFTAWTFQGRVRSGVSRVVPPKLTSAVPSFAGCTTGFQFPLLFQLLLPAAPVHVHVAAQAGAAATSGAVPRASSS